MSDLSSALRLLGLAGGVAFYMWPLSVALLLAFVMTGVHLQYLEGVSVTGLWRDTVLPISYRLLAPVFCTGAIIVIGTLCRSEVTYDGRRAQDIPSIGILLFLIAQIGWSVVLIIWSGSRKTLFVSSVMAFEVWWSLCVGFIADMAVTGDWI